METKLSEASDGSDIDRCYEHDQNNHPEHGILLSVIQPLESTIENQVNPVVSI